MKYKILKGCELFDRLISLREKCKAVNKAAFDLAETIGCHEILPKASINTIAGGVDGFRLKEKPKGFIVATKHYRDVYFPNKKLKSNKELLDKIGELPRVNSDELNKVLNYDMWAREEGDRKISFYPGVTWHYDDYILVEVSENVKYSPVEGMTEITTTEYNNLKKSKQ